MGDSHLHINKLTKMLLFLNVMVDNCSLLLVEAIDIYIYLNISVETSLTLFQDRGFDASPLIKKTGSYCNLWPHVEKQYLSMRI